MTTREQREQQRQNIRSLRVIASQRKAVELIEQRAREARELAEEIGAETVAAGAIVPTRRYEFAWARAESLRETAQQQRAALIRMIRRHEERQS